MADVLHKSAESYEPRGRLDPDGFAQHVRFQMYPPATDLADLIEHGWSIRWTKLPDTYHSAELMHRPYVDTFVSAEESGIQHTFRGKRIYEATPGCGRIVGLRFRPGAFHLLWNGSLADRQDEVMPLTEVFPELTSARIADLLTRDDDSAVVDSLLAAVRSRDVAADAAVIVINEIIGAIETEPDLTTVSAIARRFGRSERWLQQTFRDYLGVGLKWVLQRRKLLAAAAQIRVTAEPDWAGMAYDFGYSSQQHFITDFRTVLGQTPVQYWRDPGSSS